MCECVNSIKRTTKNLNVVLCVKCILFAYYRRKGLRFFSFSTVFVFCVFAIQFLVVLMLCNYYYRQMPNSRKMVCVSGGEWWCGKVVRCCCRRRARVIIRQMRCFLSFSLKAAIVILTINFKTFTLFSTTFMLRALYTYTFCHLSLTRASTTRYTIFCVSFLFSFISILFCFKYHIHALHTTLNTSHHFAIILLISSFRNLGI